MPMKKAYMAPSTETVAEKAPATEAVKETPKVETAKADSGTAAAVSRLQKSAEKGVAAQSYSGRDFAAEARGKTRCVQFEAALMSPAIAGMKWKNIDEYLELVRKAADFGLAYTFDELPKK